MLPFLLSFLDYVSSEEVFEEYDKTTARELCRRWGMSDAMYEGFLRPTLLVGLFAPPEEISAAVMLECLYFYALAHQVGFFEGGKSAAAAAFLARTHNTPNTHSHHHHNNNTKRRTTLTSAGRPAASPRRSSRRWWAASRRPAAACEAAASCRAIRGG